MRPIALLVMSVAVSVAQAAAPQFPQKRVLTPEGVSLVGQTPVVVAEISRGIEKTWFDKIHRGDAYSPPPTTGDPVADLAGAIIGAAIVEVVSENSLPHRNAQTAADEIAERLPVSFIQASLLRHIEDAKSGERGAGGVSLGAVSIVQKLLEPDPIDDALEIESSYSLADDGSAFRALFVASYRSSKLAYVTPHHFDGKPPRSERQGPLYRNVFVYRSNRLPIPPNNSDFRVLLVEAIQDNYRDDQGALPAAKSKEARSMAEEIEAANLTWHTKEDISTILTRRWLAEDGKLLKQEVENAHAFFAKYLLQDMNSTALPTMTGGMEILEAISGERIVRRLNGGVSSGSYESMPDPSGGASQYATFGNATAISKLQDRRIQNLKQHSGK